MEAVSTIGMMDLPIELKQKILFSFTPKERCNLRLVSKAMRDVVDASMSDVKEVKLQRRPGDLTAFLTTVNPFNGKTAKYAYKICHSSSSFLLQWTGRQVKSLSVTTCSCFDYYASILLTLHQIFEALNSKDACPILEELSILSCLFFCDKGILFSDLLKYVTKRQLKATNIDHPTPFLRVLLLTNEDDCCIGLKPNLTGEQIQKWLQDVLDQCHGLEELNADRVLREKSLPITALRYPTTLTRLKPRLNLKPSELCTIADNCPNLQIAEIIRDYFDGGATIDPQAVLLEYRQQEEKMKRERAAEESFSDVHHQNIPGMDDQAAAKMGNYSSKVGIMDLPIELKHRILFAIPPRERRHLRLVSKAMLDVVDTSMCDVQEIALRHSEAGYSASLVSLLVWGSCSASLKTVNPSNGVTAIHPYKFVTSSLSFLLQWAGVQLKLLSVTIELHKAKDGESHWRLARQLFDALNSENVCPKLMNLRLTMNQIVWDDNERLFRELLKYASKRQLQVMATDHPTPFLHSLSLIDSSKSTTSKMSAPNSLHSEKTLQMLQDVLEHCHGLKKLDVDSLLLVKSLPVTALRYPTTLSHLKSGRLDETPGELREIISNCPNLQIVDMDFKFLRDDANVQTLALLCDLRELTLKGYLTDEEIAQVTDQSIGAFEEYPFGVSAVRPWPQLSSVSLNCWRKPDDDRRLSHHLVLSGADCRVTSLHLTRFYCWDDSPYIQPVQRLFKALNIDNACPHLMEFSITSCELANCIGASLAIVKDRQQRTLQQPSKAFTHSLPLPSPFFYGMLNDLLAYVTKRQSEVQLGRSFLRLLSISSPGIYCLNCDCPRACLSEISDQMEHIYDIVQKIFDQCHGLGVLDMKCLGNEWVNPEKKKGKQLMELLGLRFPTTLKKLNGVWLENFSINR